MATGLWNDTMLTLAMTLIATGFVVIIGIVMGVWAGRSARVVVTSDTPSLFLRLLYRNALVWQLRGQILHFVGLRPARFTLFAPASHPKPGRVQRWLDAVGRLGASGG